PARRRQGVAPLPVPQEGAARGVRAALPAPGTRMLLPRPALPARPARGDRWMAAEAPGWVAASSTPAHPAAGEPRHVAVAASRLAARAAPREGPLQARAPRPARAAVPPMVAT